MRPLGRSSEAVMNRSYFEDLYVSDERFEERRSFFIALRERQTHLFAQRVVATLLWVIGAR